ncbi:MAG: amylo-alpha-1,6-glucosidase [Candidatus Nanohaloarchaea archaeon]
MYSLDEELGDKNGVISNLHGFLNRHFDTGFKSKWSGYWSPPYKFMDYYAVKINGIWLNESTVKHVEYGDSMIFHHEAGSLEIVEKVSTPDRLPGFKIELELKNAEGDMKAAHVAVEPAVDIRSKSEDIGDGNYTVETGKERILVSRNDKKLMIRGKGSEIEHREEKKTHYPDGEKQECFIPGQLLFKEEIEPGDKERVSLEFSTSEASFDSIESSRSEFQNFNLGQGFSAAVKSLENLVYDRKGKGLIAGHPWFQNYWARDTFWSLLGLIDAGQFELSHEILENYAEEDGFPNQISLEGDYNAPNADAPPLFVIVADYLERHWEISGKIESKIEEAFEELETGKGVVQHDSGGTWMDTLERPSAVEVQSLWLRAAELRDFEKEKEELQKGLEKFLREEKVLDHMGENPALTINPAVALMFGQIDEEYVEDINAEFSSRYGARTRSVVDPGYEASGYHTGSVWGLTTGWAAAANFENGKDVQGCNFLEKMNKFVMRNQVGGFPEVVDAENGQLLGCSEQAWSASMYIHAIDRYLLGIEVLSPEKVRIEPSSKAEGKRLQKRIGDEYLDLKFEDGEFKVLNDTNIEVIGEKQQ